MKNKINNKNIIIIILWIILTYIFFSNQILMCWDSSVYLGMSLVLGTSFIKDLWLPVRGITFPLLLRLFEPFTYQNKYLLLLMLYIFFVGLLFIIYLIGKKLNIYQNSNNKIIYLFFVILFIIINPYIFVYYHMILTEFIAMTLNMLFVYLMYNYIRFDIKDNKKALIIHGLLLSIIVIILYHTKQSFVGMMFLEFVLGILLSLFRYHDLKNILFRILNFMFCGLLLFSSVKLWHTSMNNIGLNHSTEIATEKVSSKKLISSLTKLKVVGNSKTMVYSDGNFLNNVIVISNKNKGVSTINIDNEKTKEEMIKVLNNKSIYKEFTIYELDNNSAEKYVFFTKDDYSLTEQIPLYFRIFINNPNIILSSYYDDFYKTVWIPGYWTFENRSFTYDYFHFSNTNITSVAPDYEFAVENLEENKDFDIFDNFEYGLAIIMHQVYRVNQMIVPILFLLSFSLLIYIIIKCKKYKKYKEVRNGFEMIVLLYGMSLSCIASYIMFGAFIDRYLMPSHIPMFIGDILLIIYLTKLMKLKK